MNAWIRGFFAASAVTYVMALTGLMITIFGASASADYYTKLVCRSRSGEKVGILGVSPERTADGWPGYLISEHTAKIIYYGKYSRENLPAPDRVGSMEANLEGAILFRSPGPRGTSVVEVLQPCNDPGVEVEISWYEAFNYFMWWRREVGSKR